jgi:hypothetical protein
VVPFTYRVRDAHGALSDPLTVTLLVLAPPAQPRM